ncbi:MAG TPA: M48 family metalloprotease [Syntrophorhabdaceae bacterium]|nr:M48 family metalloprotease [Syntrophorhabdaceae bacterium]
MSITSFRTLFYHVLLLAVVALAAAGCAINPVTGEQELMLVSERQEIQLGNELYPNALWSGEGGGGEFRDPALKSYLSSLVVNIHRVSHRPNLPVDFAVQNTSVPNAWAIPGHVVMTRGLLAALDNEAEFVYVMGHEMGHVSARHSARQMTYGMLGQFLLAGAAVAMAGSEYSDAALTLGSAGAGLILLKFSRNDELEADRLGVEYMTRLGYDPRAALSAHRNLEKVSDQYARSIGQSRQESSFFSELLSSHPRTSIRVEEIQNIINQTPRAAIAGDGTARQRFQGAVANIRRVNAVYVNYYDKAVRSLEKNNTGEALSFVRQAIAQDPGQAPFYALYGSILVKQNNLPEAERYFSKALSIDGNYQPALRGMGAIRYAGNRYSESVQYLQRSLKLFPQDPASNYFMGMNYYRTRSYRYAIGYLKPFSEAAPRHPRIHAILGQCYEAVGDYQSAYGQYTMQLKVAPNNDAGGVARSRSRAIEMQFAPKK